MGKKNTKKTESSKRQEFMGLVSKAVETSGEEAVLGAISNVPKYGQVFKTVAALQEAVDGNGHAPMEPKLRSVYHKAVSGLLNGGKSPANGNGNGKKVQPHGNKYGTKTRIRKLLEENLDLVGPGIVANILERCANNVFAFPDRPTVQEIRTAVDNYLSTVEDSASKKRLTPVLESLQALKRRAPVSYVTKAPSGEPHVS